jgi:glycosyltransferase involved in cell wall biosynthesis
MNIAIDIRSTLKNRTGIGTYTFGLVNALARIDKENKYLLYSYIRPFDLKRRLWPLPGRNFKHRVDRFSFNPRKTIREMDVLHTSSYDMPASKFYGLFTTIHDLVPFLFPEGYSESYLFELEGSIKRVLSESSAIIADSVNTKNDIEKMFPGVAQRIEVVYPGRDVFFKAIDKSLAFNTLKGRYGLDGRFILYSGGLDPRKNVKRLIEVFKMIKDRRKLPHKLVIVGKKSKWSAEVYETAELLGLEKEVIFTGYVPQGDLNCFYSAADCFVYPSLYEGFGFPILEAFISGTAVVTSKSSSCGEIASDAALSVDPSDNDALEEAIYRALTDRDLAGELILKGKQRAEDFSWDLSAARVLELFRGN